MDIEERKVALDEEIRRREIALKEEEAKRPQPNAAQIEDRKVALDEEIRRREVALKEEEAKRSHLTAAQATIGGAILTLVGGIIGALIAAYSSQKVATTSGLTAVDVQKIKVVGDQELEKLKETSTSKLARDSFESKLIFEAIKTASRTDAIRNLRFFVSAGFLPDYEAKISALPDVDLPSISSPSQASLSKAVTATGIVSLIGNNGGSIYTCTGAAISPHQALTSSQCEGQSLWGGNTIITMTLGEDLFTLKPVANDSKNEVTLLTIDNTGTGRSGSFGSHLDRTLIRDPIKGEHIYFAHTSGGTQAVDTTECNVTEVPPNEDWFENDCAGGPGSAGAMVIAVSDNALLGIHFLKNVYGSPGRATKLKRVISELQPQLEP